jgi:16S rRNA processing protein RimM
VRVTVGRIGRPHGIRGEVTVEVLTDEPDERFASGAAVFVGDDVRHVLRSHWHSGRLLLTFEGVDDRNAAELLRGSLITVDRPDDEQPDDGAFYDNTLIGCSVFLVTGESVGEVTDVVHLPAHELLTVRTPQGSDAYIPFVSEIVPEVDVDRRRVVIDPPPGLLDINEG